MLEENLQLGDSGNNVRILQEKLRILGFYNALITGDFGLATEEGVRAFQREYQLEETGIVDNDMWEILFSLTEVAYYLDSGYPTLNLGSSGSYVIELQTKLKALLYYTGPISGIFDNETEIAVKRFQFHNNLTTTGVANNQFWTMLNTLFGNLNECVTGSESNQPNYITYTVVSGDTLYKIAQRYNTTVDAIKNLNNLTSDNLNIGQVLKIPTSSSGSQPDYITYTVVSGDTLYKLAQRYNTTVDAIKNLNNLTSNNLSIGQVLKIPTSSSGSQPDYITYTVVSGDTLYKLAKRYATTVDAIKSLNSLTNDSLTIGQVLRIPAGSSQSDYITYTVISGDTLYKLAQRYNTTVDMIKNLNNLTSDNLSIGQVLRIPTSSNTQPDYITYTVVSGDTLYKLAQRYNTTVDAIKNLNNLTSNNLSIGQILKISI